MTRMLPTAEVGFLGMKRDEEHPTQQITYANRLPDDLTGRQCFLIDPMLATGGTLVAATHYLAERGAKDVTAVCILAAPEGIEFVEKNIDPSIDFKVVVCAVDEALNEKAYIVPGLGDAGDRLYGVIDRARPPVTENPGYRIPGGRDFCYTTPDAPGPFVTLRYRGCDAWSQSREIPADSCETSQSHEVSESGNRTRRYGGRTRHRIRPG